MASKGIQASSGQYDTGDHVLQGATFLLTLVQEAAQYAPIPYLQEAAGSVLFIFNTIATVKNNKEDFQRLADNAVSLIAAIWRSYQLSNNKNEWPSRALRDIILDLVVTLDSIVQFVQSRISKPFIVRAIYATFDATKISEYRERLTSAIQNFQVSSDLNVNEMLLEISKQQNVMWNHMQATSGTPAGLNVWQRVHPPVEAASDADVRKSKLRGPEGRPNMRRESSRRINSKEKNVSWIPLEEPEDLTNRYRPSHVPVAFNNIQNSGISIGGGAVNVVNR